MKLNGGAKHFNTLIIGAGGGGIGAFVNAAQMGVFEELLASEVLIVDRQSAMGVGTIGRYDIMSDTVGATLLECLQPESAKKIFADVIHAPITQKIEAHRHKAVPLPLIGEFMAALGASLQRELDASPHSGFMPHTEITDLHWQPDGRVKAHYIKRMGGSNSPVIDEGDILAKQVVLSSGGRQNHHKILNSPITPELNCAMFADKVLHTDFVQQQQGIAELERTLKHALNKKVVIIGASHSAFSTAWTLLNKTQIEFGESDITLLHGSKLKLFYMSKEAAHADGYFDFDENDICPATQRVFRLGGLRLESRELLMRIWRMNGRSEPRVRAVPLDRDGKNNPLDVRQLLKDAALIIPAFGYEPALMPMYDLHGKLLDLQCQHSIRMVDGECRVLDADGAPVPNLLAIGFATGYKLSGKQGGEVSYAGVNNGLWLYQNDIGAIVLKKLLQQKVLA